MRETRVRGVLATESGMRKLQDVKAKKRKSKGRIFTNADIAEAAGVDEKTVGRFFRQEQAVDESTARAICQALDVNANEVIDFSSRVKPEDKNGHLSNFNECKATDVASTATDDSASVSEREPNTSDEKRSSYAVAGTYSQVNEPKIKAILALLKDISEDTSITIVDIEKGSIKLILEASQAGLEKLEKLFKAGKLSQVLDISVEDVCFIDTDTSKSGEEIKSTDKKRLAFTIAGDITQADIAKLKAAFAQTSEREVDMEDEEKSHLIQEIIQNGAQGRNLSGTNLRCANLSDTNLRCAKLIFANLSSANLSSANLIGANLIGSKLIGANLSYTKLSDAKLIGAKLIGAKLIGANLSYANLSYAKLSDAKLSYAKLISANLSYAKLSYANLSYANVSYANLSGANLSGANLSGANVKNARFGKNLGIPESIKNNLIQRGAIFEDPPSDNSRVLIPH